MVKKILIVLFVFGILPWTAHAAPDQRQEDCGDPATLIHDLQGAEDRTPQNNQTHTLEGVVVGDFENSDTQLGGFFVQEEDADVDDDPLTSEGIFVTRFAAGPDVQVGDVVRVTGTAFEENDTGSSRTGLRNVTSVTVCSSGASAEPLEITLPVDDPKDWESYEGMLVTFSQTLTVNGVYNLGRYGEITLGLGRLFQPTNIALPGDDAAAVAALNARSVILLDDANLKQNIDPTQYPAGGLSADDALRVGYTVPGLTGILDHRFGYYRIQPTAAVTFEDSDPRPATPPEVGGTLRVASFNVLNYFNGDGEGGGFPTERGANTADEFTRQRDKIISAILAMDADVVGLMEIENDGTGPESAVADLVDGLNAAAGEEMYAYLSDPDGLNLPADGGDAIKQAIIYRPAAVTPIGDPITTVEAPFDASRPSVVQLFEQNTTGERFIVVVNHFKSKGCEDADAAGDGETGQGCWNLRRTFSAETLAAWLADDPTGTGETDVLLIGDLNAYAMEDPMMTLIDAGYSDLSVLFEGDENYSYNFGDQSGSLDHALASASLVEQVTGAGTWHINADEPRVFDYNVEFKTPNQVESFYDSGPFRSSDHDPVVVGLDLGGQVIEPTAEPTEEPTVEPTEEATEEPTIEPTIEPTEESTVAPTIEPTEAPTIEPTIAPTEAPEDESDQDDSSGGMVAIIAGAVAVLLAIIASFIGLRRRGR